MEKMSLTINARDEKITAKALRRSGKTPVVLYNHGETAHYQIDSTVIRKLFSRGVSESTLIDININGNVETAFIKDYQVHPVSEEILHLDFYRITAGEKIKTNIAIQLNNKPIGVKEGGVLEVFMHDVEIETYPRHLKPALEVDISELKIGDSIHVSDIPLPEETKIMIEGNPIVCNVSVTAKLSAEEGEEVAPEEASSEEE